ncbi:MAG: Crp/Fnr family transcriptional regulator [Schwartzia sp.]|nr:Crp/Fnr family transcriptional regulator [Schwartzia sp. (in: firmicutes)]
MTQTDKQAVWEILRRNPLVAGLSEAEREEFIAASNAKALTYEKNGTVFHEGDRPTFLYILLSGAVHIQKSAFSGRPVLLATVDTPGDMFGEVYLFLKQPYDISVEAATETRVLALPGAAFDGDGPPVSHVQFRLQRNLLAVFARKAYALNRKLQVLAAGSLREKLARLLFQEMDASGVTEFAVNRETMADWLAVTRPSLSRELGALHREGILRVDGRRIAVADWERFEQYL